MTGTGATTLPVLWALAGYTEGVAVRKGGSMSEPMKPSKEAIEAARRSKSSYAWTHAIGTGEGYESDTAWNSALQAAYDIDFANQRATIEWLHQTDSVKTGEINVLVSENKQQQQTIEELQADIADLKANLGLIMVIRDDYKQHNITQQKIIEALVWALEAGLTISTWEGFEEFQEMARTALAQAKTTNYPTSAANRSPRLPEAPAGSAPNDGNQ